MAEEEVVEGEREGVALRRMVSRKKDNVAVQQSARTIEVDYEEAETKRRHRRINAERKETNARCVKWIKGDDDWRPVEYGGDPRVQIFEKTLDDGAYLVKSRGPVKYWDAWTFAYKNMDTNYISRTMWDTDIEDITTVESIAKSKELGDIPLHIGADKMPGKLDVIWYKVAVPAVASAVGIWPRDFCCWQYWALKKDGSILITSSSTFHEKKADAAEGCVRGQTTCTMYITPLDPGPGKLDLEKPTIFVTMVGYVKPNGRIPSSVISWYRHRMGERIEFFSKVHNKACLRSY